MTSLICIKEKSMSEFVVNKIGYVDTNEGFKIVLDKKYIKALKGIGEFRYIQIVWWFDRADNEKNRNLITEKKPYKNGPEELGVFATRTPCRPNPIAITTVYVLNVDYENGVIEVSYIDALNGSPIIDIKPYMPSVDRVENPMVPNWCSHWPKNYETSGDFDWGAEFNF